MKKLISATILTALTLLSTTALAAKNFVVIHPTLTSSADPVSGLWNSIGKPTIIPFEIINANNVNMVVQISSLSNDPTTGYSLSSFTVNCGSKATPTPVTVPAGDSFVCNTNTNVVITTLADGKLSTATGAYNLVFSNNTSGN